MANLKKRANKLYGTSYDGKRPPKKTMSDDEITTFLDKVFEATDNISVRTYACVETFRTLRKKGVRDPRKINQMLEPYSNPGSIRRLMRDTNYTTAMRKSMLSLDTKDRKLFVKFVLKQYLYWHVHDKYLFEKILTPTELKLL